jgi:hypothetical protein
MGGLDGVEGVSRTRSGDVYEPARMRGVGGDSIPVQVALSDQTVVDRGRRRAPVVRKLILRRGRRR